MPTVQVLQSGYLALPIDFCKALGLKQGDILNAELVGKKIILTPQAQVDQSELKRAKAKERFFEIVDKVRERTKDISLEEIQAAIDEAVISAKQQELKERAEKM